MSQSASNQSTQTTTLGWKKFLILGLVLGLCPLLTDFPAATIILMYIGLAFFMSVVWMLYWSAKTGQLRNFEAQSRMIFDEEEPEGEVLESSFDRNRPHPYF